MVYFYEFKKSLFDDKNDKHVETMTQHYAKWLPKSIKIQSKTHLEIALKKGVKKESSKEPEETALSSMQRRTV